MPPDGRCTVVHIAWKQSVSDRVKNSFHIDANLAYLSEYLRIIFDNLKHNPLGNCVNMDTIFSMFDDDLGPQVNEIRDYWQVLTMNSIILAETMS